MRKFHSVVALLINGRVAKCTYEKNNERGENNHMV